MTNRESPCPNWICDWLQSCFLRAPVHELSVALDLIDAVCDELPRLGTGARVQRIHIRVGPSCGVVTDALRFAFDVAKAGSAIESAELEIDEQPRRSDGRDLEV